MSNIIVDVSHQLNKNDFYKFKYSDVKGYLSEADLFVDQYIKNNINQAFPNDLIFSEESKYNFSSFNDEHIWIIDPICGTTNFVKQIPFFVHSITVANKTGIKYTGIYDPNRKELFLSNGKVTKLNGKVVTVSDTRELRDCIISINTNQSASMDKNILNIEKLVAILAPPLTRRIKIFESANLELAYVACGRLDAYVCLSDKIWDMAAGYHMIQSSGGTAKAIKGSLHPLDLCSLGIIASNRFLFDGIFNKLKIKITK